MFPRWYATNLRISASSWWLSTPGGRWIADSRQLDDALFVHSEVSVDVRVAAEEAASFLRAQFGADCGCDAGVFSTDPPAGAVAVRPGLSESLLVCFHGELP
jgi:hypothetical protein